MIVGRWELGPSRRGFVGIEYRFVLRGRRCSRMAGSLSTAKKSQRGGRSTFRVEERGCGE